MVSCIPLTYFSDRTSFLPPTSNPTRSAPPHPTYHPDGLALSPSAIGALYELAPFIVTLLQMSPTASNPLPAEPESSQPSSVQPAQDEQNNVTADHFPEPFPKLGPSPPFQYNASLHRLDTVSPQAHPMIASPHVPSPPSAGLKLQTDHLNEKKREELAGTNNSATIGEPHQTIFNAGLPVRTTSLRKAYTRTHRADSLSPASAISSPGVGPLVEMTPLPSPVSPWGIPGLGRRSIDDEREEAAPDTTMLYDFEEPKPDIVPLPRSTPKKRAIPDNVEQARIYDANAAAYAKNRSVSEYVPEGMQIPKSRNIVVSTGAPSIEQQSLSPPEDHMHREHYLAVQRGLAISIPNPPTPPDSNRGKENDEVDSPSAKSAALKGPVPLVYEAYMVRGGKLRKWRALRQLGKGTFSNVMLATSEGVNTSDGSLLEPKDEEQVDSKSLVAVKICQLGPAGGADEQKIETSIKREVEIMKSINHPSLVHLKAVNMCERQTFLVLNYCAGGDLFELANQSLDVLTPSLIRRMFAELVAAVRYLHLQYIVHRDIKLESTYIIAYSVP